MLTGVSLAKIVSNEGMNIVSRFPKVKSQYVLRNKFGQDRYVISLGKKSFTSTHQVKKGNDWVEIAKSIFKGSADTVLEKFRIYTQILSKSDYC